MDKFACGVNSFNGKNVSTGGTNGKKIITSSKGLLECNGNKSRRYRSAFTTDQITYLENQFRKFPYIGTGNRKDIADALNMPERAVKIWFQNRRMKEKRFGNREIIYEYHNKFESDKSTNKPLHNAYHLQSTNDQFLNVPPPLKINDTSSNITKVENEIRIVRNKVNKDTKDVTDNEITALTNSLQTSPESSNVNYQTIKNEKCNKKVFKQSSHLEKNCNEKEYTKVQEVPHDLSRPKVSQEEQAIYEEHLTKKPSESGYVPIYLQNSEAQYGSNMLFKPIKVFPCVVNTNSMQNLYNRGPHIVMNQGILRNNNCQCDCHAPQYVTEVREQGQYIPVFPLPYPYSSTEYVTLN
ncbi:uncharacterized protein LOC126966970 [Leptidea sinapis]|uniref:uncharacterized protein LOC126966970 n=1 Tax=Leptidea sinapis TaxID=189913 RepID=UPI0021C3FF4F|nr:uncharacterized protein LOC126966970 [Leptidea sinapis]